jgi:hypothetical protein
MRAALVLARRAGFAIRPVPTGGAVARMGEYTLDVGPLATAAEIAAIARQHMAPEPTPMRELATCPHELTYRIERARAQNRPTSNVR